MLIKQAEIPPKVSGNITGTALFTLGEKVFHGFILRPCDDYVKIIDDYLHNTVTRYIRLNRLQYIIGKTLLLYKLKVALFGPVQITSMTRAMPPQERKLHRYLIKVLRFG